MKRTKKRLIIALSVTVVIIAAVVIACVIYLNDYYHADDEAIAAFCVQGVSESTDEAGNLIFAPESPTAGFIFYPGGKVEHTAYIPLMRAIAENGILCVLIDMPFNLAVFDMKAADGITESYREIESWYIGGHSLGGSMAASYAADNPYDFDGVILLGSYSTAELSETELEVISIYGSCDGVMNREKYEQYKDNLPESFEEYIIDGGNHAHFGMYGEQDGDGTASISATEQIQVTALQIAYFILI